jgi:GTP cyclohydrolase I
MRLFNFGASDEEIEEAAESHIDPRVPDTMKPYADNIEEILLAFGWDMTNPSVENTPMRFLKYLAEFHRPYTVADVLGEPFMSPDSSMVIQDNIPFRMVCEHHLLPAFGKAALGYIPDGKVVGLSKMARLVDAVGTFKPSLQEHIADRIVNDFNNYLEPKGVMLVIEAEHGCMACRGVNKPRVFTRTSTTKGVFFDNHAARNEFLSIAKFGG